MFGIKLPGDGDNFSLFFILFSFLRWCETESTWYLGHYLLYCALSGLWMIMSVEHSVEWVSGETEVHLLLCRFVHHKSHVTGPWLEFGRRDGKAATNRVNCDTTNRDTVTYRWSAKPTSSLVGLDCCNDSSWDCLDKQHALQTEDMLSEFIWVITRFLFIYILLFYNLLKILKESN
jgi:hypothetical protein